MNINKKLNAGFTLIELLVVVLIIAILGAVATPVALRFIDKARKANAQVVCSALEQAIDNFEQEYNYLPYAPDTAPVADTLVHGYDSNDVTTGNEVNDGLLAVLAGLDDDKNPKKSVFFDPGEATGTKDGLLIDDSTDPATVTLYDPWGNLYYIIIDYDYSGSIQHPFDDDREVRKNAICWSAGVDELWTNSDDAEDQKQNTDNAANFKQ